MATSPDQAVEAAAQLAPDVRQALRDLLLVLADSKRLLGFRYAGWILGAPELESGIACAAMAQDEWGHARLTYALLQDFGDDVVALEHDREPDHYCNMEVLDREPQDWAGVIALNALADTALSVQFEALGDCCYLPLRQRTGKLLAEERYHAAHGGAWARRYLRAGAGARDRFAALAADMLPRLLAWFGPESGRGALLAEAGVCDASPDALRGRFLARVTPLLALLGPGAPTLAAEMPALAFDDVRRRTRARAPGAAARIDSLTLQQPGPPADAGATLLAVGTSAVPADSGAAGSSAAGGLAQPDGPDQETIVHVRGDRNRHFLLD